MKAISLTGAALLALTTAPALAQDAATAASAPTRVADASRRPPYRRRDARRHRRHRAEAHRAAAGRAGRGLGHLGRRARAPRARSTSKARSISCRRSTSANRAPTINQSLFLRGVGTSTFSIAGEPSISTVVDGVVYSRAGEAFSDLIDIDRIEVLRGPQGTLFGKNASAGVINIVTKRPGDDSAASSRAAISSATATNTASAARSTCRWRDNVSSRVTGFYGNYDGNIRNIANGNARQRLRALRRARHDRRDDPTPDLTLTLIGDYRKSDDDCCAEVIGTAPTNVTAGALRRPRAATRPRDDQPEPGHRTDREELGLLGCRPTGRSARRRSPPSAPTATTTTPRSATATSCRAYVGFNQLHDFGPQTEHVHPGTAADLARRTSSSPMCSAPIIRAPRPSAPSRATTSSAR